MPGMCVDICNQHCSQLPVDLWPVPQDPGNPLTPTARAPLLLSQVNIHSPLCLLVAGTQSSMWEMPEAGLQWGLGVTGHVTA